jgi:hypothetical protein
VTILFRLVLVQVPLVKAIELLVLKREEQKRWFNYRELTPDKESYALMEEFLFWVAVLHRWVYRAALPAENIEPANEVDDQLMMYARKQGGDNLLPKPVEAFLPPILMCFPAHAGFTRLPMSCSSTRPVPQQDMRLQERCSPQQPLLHQLLQFPCQTLQAAMHVRSA